jgi:hypothetical protein
MVGAVCEALEDDRRDAHATVGPDVIGAGRRAVIPAHRVAAAALGMPVVMAHPHGLGNHVVNEIEVDVTLAAQRGEVGALAAARACHRTGDADAHQVRRIAVAIPTPQAGAVPLAAAVIASLGADLKTTARRVAGAGRSRAVPVVRLTAGPVLAVTRGAVGPSDAAVHAFGHTVSGTAFGMHAVVAIPGSTGGAGVAVRVQALDRVVRDGINMVVVIADAIGVGIRDVSHISDPISVSTDDLCRAERRHTPIVRDCTVSVIPIVVWLSAFAHPMTVARGAVISVISIVVWLSPLAHRVTVCVRHTYVRFIMLRVPPLSNQMRKTHQETRCG